MAGVRLRMTEGQVRANLGTPLRITRTRGALGSVVMRMHYRRVDVDLRLHVRPVVIRVLTTRPGERTASGVGVGSAISAAARLTGAHCWWQAVSTRYCEIGNPNEPLSGFTLFLSGVNERVTMISIALALNS
jgi:hypothetical protein